jgi:hypothetical protein
MKPYKSILWTFLAVLISQSCKRSFLDVPDKSAITRQSYITDLKTTDEFLNGIYTILSEKIYSSKGQNQIYPEIIADNIKPVTSASTVLAPHYNWQQQAEISGSNMNDIWLSGYLVIRSCSFVVEKSTEYRAQDPSRADNMKAQALAIRAMTHAILTNIFAQPFGFSATASHPGIPYITTSDYTQSVTRNTVAEVYDGMISDLKEAIFLFSEGSMNVLYMNRNAAKALLARVYLFKQDYLNAKNLAREVGTAVPIMTGSSYPSKLFTLQETEALFQLAPAGVANSALYTTDYQGRYFVSPKQFIATADIATLLTERSTDVRKAWVNLVSGIWNISKYPLGVVPGFSIPSLSYYPTLLRSSEMYLTAAEAYVHLNNVDSARFYLDAIRQRADVTVLATTTAGTTLLDAIYKERRKELAFEGLRMFDLLRWKQGVNRIDTYGPATQNLPYPSNKAIAPLPINEVTISGFKQNIDY